MHVSNGRMIDQHRRRVGIHQRVELAGRCLRLQCRKHRRGQQHVAVMTQFDHERPAQRVKRNVVFGHPDILPDAARSGG
jgi:hypothetical protein